MVAGFGCRGEWGIFYGNKDSPTEQRGVLKREFDGMINLMRIRACAEQRKGLRTKPGKRPSRVNVIGTLCAALRLCIECYRHTTTVEFFKHWFETWLLKAILWSEGYTVVLNNASFFGSGQNLLYSGRCMPLRPSTSVLCPILGWLQQVLPMTAFFTAGSCGCCFFRRTHLTTWRGLGQT